MRRKASRWLRTGSDMTFWSLLFLLVMVAALVAYLGDAVAKRVGKLHWRVFGLRPRATATVVAVITGMLIALGAFGTFLFVAKDARETIIQAEQVRQERNQLRTEVRRLEGSVEGFRREAARAFADRSQLASERQQLEDALKGAQDQLQKAQTERDKLTAELESQRKAQEQAAKEVAQLEAERKQLEGSKADLEAAQAKLKTDAQAAQQRLDRLVAASKLAKAELGQLQFQMRKLSAQKQSLEGDVALLYARQKEITGERQGLEAEVKKLQDALQGSQKEQTALRTKVAELVRENGKLKEIHKLMQASLEKLVSQLLLAEQAVTPGQEKAALDEIIRRTEARARLLGLKGSEVVAAPSFDSPSTLGLLLARSAGVTPEGRLLVKIEFRPREQAFASGELLAVGSVVLPMSPENLRRTLDLVRKDAEQKLAEAGWVPEKLAQGGFGPSELVNFMNAINGRRGPARIGIIALDNLYPTEPPRFGLKLLQ